MNREAQARQEREINIQCMVKLMVDRSMVVKATEMLNDTEEWAREAARQALIRMNADMEEPKDA